MPLPFSENEMKKIYGTLLTDVAKEMGFILEPHDRKTFHVKEMGGLYIYKPEYGRGWYQFVTEKSGNIVEFVMEFGNMGKREAMEYILKSKAYSHCNNQIAPSSPAPKKTFELPPKADSYKQMIAYLIGSRMIDKEVLYHCIKNDLVYQAKKVLQDGKTVFNCAFVGRDKDNVARHCHLRSTNSYSKFRGDVEGSDKNFGFSLRGTNSKLFVFESAIDSLSGASMIKKADGDCWSENHFLSTNGATNIEAINKYLSENEIIDEVYLCYDNDEAGREWTALTTEHLLSKGLTVVDIVSVCKDINEDLRNGIDSFYSIKPIYDNAPVPICIIEHELEL